MGAIELLRELMAAIMNCGGVQMAIAPIVAAAAISAAASIGNALFGSASARKQKKKQLAAIREQEKENRNWYNRRYYEDATQRADAQRMFNRANEANKRRTKAAYGRKDVVGGTDATLASTQQANAAAMADATSSIVADAESRKDDIEQQYRSRQQALEAQKSDVNAAAEQSKRENTAAATTGAIQAMASVIGNSGTSGSTGASKVSGSNNTTSTQRAMRNESLTRTNSTLAQQAGAVHRQYARKNPWDTAQRINF